MTVCDICKDPTKRAVEYRITIGRVVTGQSRTTSQAVHTGAVELCEGCISKAWDQILRAVPNGHDTRNETGA